MYLDPRFQFDLDDNNREAAIKHIIHIHKKLQRKLFKFCWRGDFQGKYKNLARLRILYKIIRATIRADFLY